MKPAIFSPAAREDLLAIGLYIAEDNPYRADSFVAELEAKVSSIGASPQSFPMRNDVSPGLRCAIHGRYLIFFRDLAHEVRIIRILHGSRNLPLAFDP